MLSQYSTVCRSCGVAMTTRGHKVYCDNCLRRTCQQCGTSFRVKQTTASGKFCSHDCYSDSKKGGVPWNKGTSALSSRACGCCGVQFQASPWMATKFCSQECSGKEHRGENSVNWRGGSSRTPDAAEYKAWRLAVLVRDNGRCRWCDSEGVRNCFKLEVHHIVPFSSGPPSTIDNGITLCSEHHRKTKGRENELAERFAFLLERPLVALPTPNRKDRAPLVTSEEELRRLYWDDKLGTPVIGEMKGVTGACVLRHMRRYGIARRSGLEAASCRP
jgi:HNH endonuclease